MRPQDGPIETRLSLVVQMLETAAQELRDAIDEQKMIIKEQSDSGTGGKESESDG